MYAAGGRRSVPPETLLKATVLMALYSIRSERAFCERLNYDLMFKWFLDLRIDQPAFDATTFTKNRHRLLEHEVADEFFAAVVRQAKLRKYLSSDPFAGDKDYDTRGFVADVRGLGFTPHVAPNTSRPRSAIDARTTRHPGHQVSQRIRKRIEEPFGWIKTIAGGRKLRYRGRQRNRA